jgi:hypothetical protein
MDTASIGDAVPIDISDILGKLFSEEAAVADAAQKRAVRKARARWGWDKKEAERNRRIAAMHRPKGVTRADSIPVYPGGRRIILSCWVEQPKAVHATRRFDALLNEITRLIAAGDIVADEVSFLCSEFFYYTRDHHNWFVLEPGNPAILANAWSADYAAKTITFKSERDGYLHSLTISPPRFDVIAWYLAV